MNRIAFNGGPGVGSGRARASLRPRTPSTRTAVSASTGKNDGLTPNQPPGTFVYENAPILTAATTSPAGTSVSGTLASGLRDHLHGPRFRESVLRPVRLRRGAAVSGRDQRPDDRGRRHTLSRGICPLSAPAGSYISALAVTPPGAPTTARPRSSRSAGRSRVIRDRRRSACLSSLFLVIPAQGGNGGSVTLIVTGESIAPTASVKLSRSGQPDIPGEFTARRGPAGATSAPIFNLTGAEPGTLGPRRHQPEHESATALLAASSSKRAVRQTSSPTSSAAHASCAAGTRLLRRLRKPRDVDAYGSTVILAGIPLGCVGHSALPGLAHSAATTISTRTTTLRSLWSLRSPEGQASSSFFRSSRPGPRPCSACG